MHPIAPTGSEKVRRHLNIGSELWSWENIFTLLGPWLRRDTHLLKFHLAQTFIETYKRCRSHHGTGIIDFDGITDAEVRGNPIEKDTEDVAMLVDVSIEQVNTWAEQMDIELQRPGDFGWRFNDKIVAPAV